MSSRAEQSRAGSLPVVSPVRQIGTMAAVGVECDDEGVRRRRERAEQVKKVSFEKGLREQDKASAALEAEWEAKAAEREARADGWKKGLACPSPLKVRYKLFK